MVGASSQRSGRSGSSSSSRPRLQSRRSTYADGQVSDPSQSQSTKVEPVPQHRREIQIGPPGQLNVPDQRTPLRSIRMPDDFEPMASPTSGGPISSAGSTGTASRTGSVKSTKEAVSGAGEKRLDAKHLRVLIAEDDPVNSRIIKKRLEKLGHLPYLTVNGEECASAYGEKTAEFDVVSSANLLIP